ncbi:MAG: glycoside hydrolase family 17 protein [Rhodanobacter sp.]
MSSLLPSYRHALAWLWLALGAVAGACVWWVLGQPVTLPDAPSARVACVSYSPFRKLGETPLNAQAHVSAQRIDADLRALSKRFDCVRTYSQGQGLDVVPEIAERYGMKVLLGIWIGGDLAANAQQIEWGVAVARAHPQALRGVIVGNEVLLRGEQSAQTLATYLREVRAAVPREVPVSYADVWEFWLQHPSLADDVDVITIHILPYWEDQPVAPERAVEHVAAVYAKVQQAFPGKRVMIGETGWPSAGRSRGEARASVVNEARYLREFLRYAATVQMPYNVIEAFDQPWKRGQEGTVGGYWGIFDSHARPKFAMQGPVVEVPRWWLGELAGVATAMLFLLVGVWRRRWRGGRGWWVLGLAGFASGTALAWQWRQITYASRNTWEWSVSITACVCALLTAMWLARWLAQRLSGITAPALPAVAVRFAWLFALAFYGLLLVFDGRYRDFPLGLFALPSVGYALVGWLTEPARRQTPLLEARFLIVWLTPLAAAVVVLDRGLDPIGWLWLGLNVLISLPVLLDWRQSAQRMRLQAQQA